MRIFKQALFLLLLSLFATSNQLYATESDREPYCDVTSPIILTINVVKSSFLSTFQLLSRSPYKAFLIEDGRR
jgi:predicted permease